MSAWRYLCLWRGHKRSAPRAWFDDLDWRSECRRCGTPLLKDGNGWRRFGDGDVDLRRVAKPVRRNLW